MPFAFTCPHCGHQTNVADQYAGMSGPCARCGQTVTMPGAALHAPSSSRRTVSTVTIVLVVVCIAAVLGCGLLAAWVITGVRTAAHHAVCINNLNQIGFAMQAYEQQYGSLPPAYIADAQGNPLHSWRVLILPYLGQEGLYRQYRFDEPWNGPNNCRLVDQMPSVYQCPGDGAARTRHLTSYVVVVDKKTAFPGIEARRSSELPDGLHRTLLVVESCGAGINWMEPRDLYLELMNPRINKRPGIGSMHGNGASALFADGHVERLLDGMPAAMLRSLLDARDGKPSVKEWKELTEP